MPEDPDYGVSKFTNVYKKPAVDKEVTDPHGTRHVGRLNKMHGSFIQFTICGQKVPTEELGRGDNIDNG